MSAFERGRISGLREAGLSYRVIAARTGHAATTVMRVWNQWREEGRTQRGAGTGPRNVTTGRDDSHIVCMAVTGRTASFTVLSRHWSTVTGLDVCFSSSSPSFEGWTNGSHAITSASIAQRPPTPQTAMGT